MSERLPFHDGYLRKERKERKEKEVWKRKKIKTQPQKFFVFDETSWLFQEAPLIIVTLRGTC